MGDTVAAKFYEVYVLDRDPVFVTEHDPVRLTMKDGEQFIKVCLIVGQFEDVVAPKIGSLESEQLYWLIIGWNGL